MGFEDLVIVKVLVSLTEAINDNIENPILNGLAWIIFFLSMIYFFIYIWIYGAFTGHLSRFFWILGIWLLIELANLIGGGHNNPTKNYW